MKLRLVYLPLLLVGVLTLATAGCDRADQAATPATPTNPEPPKQN